MAQEFMLPEIGEGVVEGEIVDWLVAVGDNVKEDQPLVSILTDKATVEIPAGFNGAIVSLNGAAGETVEVGGRLVEYEAAGGAPAAAKPQAPKNVSQASAQAGIVGLRD